jgi:competence ComEA-like helix-hairpin-helix protein
VGLSGLLTPSEKRLAALLFVLTLLGSVTRVGRRLSPEVETWLQEERTHAGSPVVGEPAAPSRTGHGDTATAGGERSSKEQAEKSNRIGIAVDPNTADRQALERLPGVGPVLAGRILEDRIRNGPYRSAEDLLRVKGIGERTLERLRPHLLFP